MKQNGVVCWPAPKPLFLIFRFEYLISRPKSYRDFRETCPRTAGLTTRSRCLLDCKTVRIFAYSSTREQSNEAENRPYGRVRLARVRLLRHALPISLLILRKKPTVLQSTYGYAYDIREVKHHLYAKWQARICST